MYTRGRGGAGEGSARVARMSSHCEHDDIAVTPEMVKAGEDILDYWDPEHPCADSAEEKAVEVFNAMWAAYLESRNDPA